jgi:muramidase (phage lysozyme)
METISSGQSQANQPLQTILGAAVTVADTSDAPLARAALSANTNGQFHRSLQRGRSAPKIFEFASLVRVAP